MSKVFNNIVPILSKSLHIIVTLYLIYVTILTVVPIFPKFPASNLDPSWELSLNEAVSKGYTFGDEIVFTYGPLSSSATFLYHTDNYYSVLLFSIIICYSFLISLISIIKNNTLIIFSFTLVIATVSTPSIDSIFLFFPFIGYLYLKNTKNTNYINYTLVIFSLLSITQIKLSYSILVFFVISLLIFNNLYCKNYKLLMPIAIGSSALVVIIQAIYDISLYKYYYNLLIMSKSYAEAMLYFGPYEHFYMYFVLSLFVFIFINKIINSIDDKSILIILLMLTLFISFKAGFTRHDIHVLISIYTIIFILLILLNNLKFKFAVVFLLLVLPSNYLLFEAYLGSSTNYLLNMKNDFIRLPTAAKVIVGIDDEYEKRYHSSLSYIEGRFKFPIEAGATDLYNYNISAIIASGNSWSPRPIFQSYAAYTPELAEINRNHVLSNPPDNVFINVETIDERFPTLDDGSIWPIFLSSYSPDTTIFDYLLIKRDSTVYLPNHSIVGKAVGTIGQIVEVPVSDIPVFATVELNKTIIGAIKNLVYKPEPLQIIVYYDDFSYESFRFIASMAKSPFLISPMVSNTSEFLNLYSDIRKNKRLRFIKINTNGFGTDWEQNYHIEFRVYEQSK